MKIHEYNEMMAYLTRPSYVSGGRVGFAQGTPGLELIEHLKKKKDVLGRPYISSYQEKLKILEDLQKNKYINTKTNKAFTPKEWLDASATTRSKARDPQAFLDKKSEYQRDYVRKRKLVDPAFKEQQITSRKESYYKQARKKSISSGIQPGRGVLIEQRNKMLSYMSNAAQKGNTNYTEIIKDGKFLGVRDNAAGINYYEAGYKGKLGSKSKLITAHPDFKNVNDLAKLADKGFKRALPNKAIQSYFSAYGRVPKMGELYNYLQADPRYLSRMDPRALTNNPLQLHHQISMTESPTRKFQLLLKDRNNQAGVLMEEFKKGNITKDKLSIELKKINARVKADGRYIGAKDIVPEQQVKVAKKQTTQLFNKMLKENPKQLENIVKQLNDAPNALKLKIGGALGCVGKASGGRVGLKAGSGLMQCISSKLDNNPQGTLAKVAKEVPETRGPIRSALGMTGKAFGRFIMGALGPTGIVGMTAGFGVDPKSAVDRMGIEAEAVFAPELVKATIGATKGMKNRGAQKVVQQLLNLGMPTQIALRVARVAQPLGLLALGGEGLYKMYKEGHFEKERMMPSLMDKEAYAGAQQEQFDVNQPMFNQGGRVGLAKGPKDPSKRLFLKGVAAASLIPIIGKYFKLAAPATKAAAEYTGPILEGLGSKLKWVQLLAKRLWNEGDDITETASTVEREIVKAGKLESGDDVVMFYNKDTNDVRFSVTGKDTGEAVSDTTSGAYNKQYDLEYKAPEVIDEGKHAGKKTKSEVQVVEEYPRQVTPEDVELDVIDSPVDSALSDLTELEAFAKKKTIKDIHKKKGTTPKDVAPDWEPPDYDWDDFIE